MQFVHLRHRMRLLAVVVLIALVGIVPSAPSHAQPAGPSDAARLRAAMDSIAQIAPVQATEPERGAAARPVYAMEGPRA
ncbi:MAG: hypothetical protein H7Y32_03665, partial [Chloroflexales bacterium]|nr:hypothetical protein [Chloroflexales bacterium]